MESGWRTPLRRWWETDVPLWVFIAKTCAAGTLALWIAFRLDFAQPQWSLLTVCIVAGHESGLVLTKSFYRILGTIAGSLATVVFVGLFDQSRELFLLALALWVGTCVTLAARYRNFQSYAFLLAGYTACLIGFNAALHPANTFDIAQARVSEVVLGILCAGVVTNVVWPRRLADAVLRAVGQQFAGFTRFLDNARDQHLASASNREAHLAFVSEVMALEARRSNLYFEDPDQRLLGGRLRAVNAEFMAASTTFHAFGQCLARLRAPHDGAAARALENLYDEFIGTLHADGKLPATAEEAVPLVARLKAFEAALPARWPAVAGTGNPTAQEPRDANYYDVRNGFDLLTRFVREFIDYTSAYASLSGNFRAYRQVADKFTVHVDPLLALISGARAAAVMLAISVFWIATDWPDGPTAAALACTFCALFAAAPSPVAAARQTAFGFAIGVTVGYACLYGLLPHVDGFPLLVMAMLPGLVVFAWLAGRPRSVLLGAACSIGFLSVLIPNNPINFDLAAIADSTIASFIGVAVTGLAYSVFPVSVHWQHARLLKRLRLQVVAVCRMPQRGEQLRQQFESRTRDLYQQLAALLPRRSAEATQAMDTAMSVLEIGHAILDLRRLIAADPPVQPLAQAIKAMLGDVARLFRAPSPDLRARARASLDALCHEIDLSDECTAQPAPASSPAGTSGGGSHLRLVLQRMRTVLADDAWYRDFAMSAQSQPGQEVRHAA